MALERRHWAMIGGAVLATVLLALAPRTPSAKAEGAEGSARVSEDPTSGSTPQAEEAGAQDMPAIKDPKVAAIIAELNSGAPPMQTILKLRELAEKEPANVEAQYHLGLFSWQTGQYDKAMERFRTVIELDPTGHPDAFGYLGRAYSTLDSVPQAIAAYEKYRSLVNEPELIHTVDSLILQLKQLPNAQR